MKLSQTVHKLSGSILCPSIELSLTLTLLGGQSFRWKQITTNETSGSRFQGIFKDRLWTLWQDPSHLHYEVYSKDNVNKSQMEAILRDYFRLDENLVEHYRNWSSQDGFFKQTCGEFVGIRMLNQDLRENIFSFLCSSNNNIARISGMIDKMCIQYGEPICTLDEESNGISSTQTNGNIKEEPIESKAFEISNKKNIKKEQNEDVELKVENGASKRGAKRKSSDESLLKIKTETVGDIIDSARRTTRRSSKLDSVKSEEKFDESTEKSLQTNGIMGKESTKNQKGFKKVQSTIKTEYVGKVEGTKSTSFYSFPSIESLADPAVESKLRELGFGYRAKFIQQSAAYILKQGGEQWLQKLQRKSYEEARAELMNLQGIGAKVADCICLMSLSHLQSVPVDTHVYQIAVNHYAFAKSTSKTLTPSTYNEIRGFFINKFGPYAGWAHSILFCADLKKFQTKSPEKIKKRKVSA